MLTLANANLRYFQPLTLKVEIWGIKTGKVGAKLKQNFVKGRRSLQMCPDWMFMA